MRRIQVVFHNKDTHLHVVAAFGPKVLIKSMGGWRDAKEIAQFYEHAHLKKEVKPVIDFLSKISKNFQVIQSNPDLLDELPISDPLSWSAETMYEFTNPDKYYKESLNEEFDDLDCD